MKNSILNTRFWIGIILIGMALSFGGCKTIKDKTRKDDSALRDIDKRGPSFRTYNAKLDIKFKGLSFSGTLRMVKDSAIWLSVGKFGFEGGRILMTKDSVWFLNKVEREYYKGSYDIFTKLLGLTLSYDIAESLILGKDFTSYKTNDYRLIRDNDILRYSYDLRRSLYYKDAPKLKQDIFYNRASKQIIRNYFEVVGTSYSLDTYYDSYSLISDVYFPNTIRVNAYVGKSLRADINSRSQSINEVFDMPFSIPGSYSLMK